MSPSPVRCEVSAEQRREAQRLVGQARRATAARDYPAALTAFRAALVLDACDAKTLGELGWVAYLARDLTLAEDSTRAAIARGGTPETRGATFYNLGVILEARGARPNAISALRESLRNRASGRVLERLEQLDPTAALQVRTLTAKPAEVVTPLASLCRDGGELLGPGDERALVAPPDLGPSGPFRSVRTVQCWYGATIMQYVALETAAASGAVTTRVSDLHFRFTQAVSGASTGGNSVSDLRYQQVVPGGPPEVVVSASGSFGAGGALPEAEYFERSDSELALCGIGPSGVPACTEPVPTLLVTNAGDARGDYQLEPTFPASGGLVLSHRAGPLPDAARFLVGTHPVVFP